MPAGANVVSVVVDDDDDWPGARADGGAPDAGGGFNTLFTLAMAAVLQGDQGEWTLRGSTQVHTSLGGVALGFPVHMEKEMLLPPTMLEQVRPEIAPEIRP